MFLAAKSMLLSWMSRFLNDDGMVYTTEYVVVFAGVVMMLTPFLPQGFVYTYLRTELQLRMTLISLPIF